MAFLVSSPDRCIAIQATLPPLLAYIAQGKRPERSAPGYVAVVPLGLPSWPPLIMCDGLSRQARNYWPSQVVGESTVQQCHYVMASPVFPLGPFFLDIT